MSARPHTRYRLELGVALIALLLASACTTGPTRNDPKRRALAALGVSLDLARLPGEISGSGRLRISLMAEGKGEAVEAPLEWRLEPGKGLRFARRQRGRADVLLFQNLEPDSYRLASWAIAGRYETPEGRPILISRRGVFDKSLEGVRIEAGELVDLGHLDLTVQPTWAFTFRMEKDDNASRLASVREEYPRLSEPFRERSTLLRGGLPPASAAPKGRAVTSPPIAPAPIAPAPAPPKPGIAVLGFELRAHGELAAAPHAEGTLTLVVRRVGSGKPSKEITAPWRFGSITEYVDGKPRAIEMPSSPREEAHFVVRIAERAGEYEILALRIDGSARIDDVDRRILVEPSLQGTVPFTVGAGQALDLGVSRVELFNRIRGSFIPLEVTEAASATRWLDSEDGAADRELAPKSSPIRPVAGDG